MHKAAATGLVEYYVDGYEEFNEAGISADNFDRTKYEKKQLSAMTEAAAGDPAYKLITSEAIVSYGKGNTIVNDTGSLQYDGHEVINAGRAKYGRIGMAQALRVSSNVYFSTVAKEICSEPISEIFSKKFKSFLKSFIYLSAISSLYCSVDTIIINDKIKFIILYPRFS